MTPLDPGGYLSYTDNLLIAFGISIITSIVFFLFYKGFHNSNKLFLVASFSFLTQVLANITSIVIPDIGIFSFTLSFMIFPLLANFFLRRLNQKS